MSAKNQVVWYGNGRKSDDLNKVEKLMAQTRTIPQSCQEKRDTTLITFRPCNPDSIHTHDMWHYTYSAWDSVQEKGHCGTGGKCLGFGRASNFMYAMNFYLEHKNAKYCIINAMRMMSEKPQKWVTINDCKQSVIDTSHTTGNTQYVTLYLKCDGCGCNTSNFEDWMSCGEPSSQCTNELCKPSFVVPTKK